MGRIVLKIVLAGKTVFRSEDVIDIRVDLIGVKLARWAFHERIERLSAAFRLVAFEEGMMNWPLEVLA